MSMNEREQLAKDNGMTIEFVNWFFDNKKDGCGNAWFIMMAAMWEGWSGREAKCAALAAKGMELAAEAAVVYGKYNETQMPDRDLVDMQTLQEMHDLCAGVKNADAFLAEVRAQGVEMFADFWEENCRHNDTFIGGEAKKFAAQLRQGGAV